MEYNFKLNKYSYKHIDRQFSRIDDYKNCLNLLSWSLDDKRELVHKRFQDDYDCEDMERWLDHLKFIGF